MKLPRPNHLAGGIPDYTSEPAAPHTQVVDLRRRRDLCDDRAWTHAVTGERSSGRLAIALAPDDRIPAFERYE